MSPRTFTTGVIHGGLIAGAAAFLSFISDYCFIVLVFASWYRSCVPLMANHIIANIIKEEK